MTRLVMPIKSFSGLMCLNFIPMDSTANTTCHANQNMLAGRTGNSDACDAKHFLLATTRKIIDASISPRNASRRLPGRCKAGPKGGASTSRASERASRCALCIAIARDVPGAPLGMLRDAASFLLAESQRIPSNCQQPSPPSRPPPHCRPHPVGRRVRPPAGGRNNDTCRCFPPTAAPFPSPPVVVATPAVDNDPNATMTSAIFGDSAARRACAL